MSFPTEPAETTTPTTVPHPVEVGVWGPPEVKPLPKPSLWDVAMGYGFIIFLPLLPAIFIMILVVSSATSTNPETISTEVSDALTKSGPGIMVALMATWLAMILPVWLAGRKMVGGWKALVKWTVKWKQDVLIAVGFTVTLTALLAIVSQIITLFGVDPNSLGNTGLVTDQKGIWLLLVAAGAVIGAPLAEELFFRGLFFNVLAQKFYDRKWGVPIAIIISSFGFGILHVQATLAASIYTISVTTFLGMCLAFLYNRTQRLGTTILAHSLFNFTGVVLALVFSS